MGVSKRAQQQAAQRAASGYVDPYRASRQGSARPAYIDFDVTGNADLGEEGTDPLTPGNGLPQGGLIDSGDNWGMYGANNNNIYHSINPVPVMQK